PASAGRCARRRRSPRGRRTAPAPWPAPPAPPARRRGASRRRAPRACGRPAPGGGRPVSACGRRRPAPHPERRGRRARRGWRAGRCAAAHRGGWKGTCVVRSWRCSGVVPETAHVRIRRAMTEGRHAAVLETGPITLRRPEADLVLHVPAFTLAPGGAVALLGPSASGKTTLLEALLGVARGGTTIAGARSFLGAPVPVPPGVEWRAWLRRSVAFVPQGARAAPAPVPP